MISKLQDCVEAGADPRAIISSQEARAVRLAAGPETSSNDGEEYHDDEHPSDDERRGME
jgi:hypothetical protein